MVETDDDAEIERLSDALELLACSEDHSEAGADIPCRLPWFVTVSYLDPDEATSVELRSVPNR